MAESGQKLTGKKVLVAMTGRIDSCVAAFLLKKQGMDVYGLSIVTTGKDIVNDEKFLPKCHIVDLDKVSRFCESIGISFYATDAKSVYDSLVVDNIIANKLTGRANATCFNCTRMRMHVAYEKMLQLKCDFISTGHYAKVHKNLNSNKFFIHSNNDTESDQSFLLAGLDNKILSRLILPLGELKKSEVVKIAKSFNLEADISSEQKTFCFRETDSMEKIIKERIPKSMIKEGIVINIDNGNNYGDHKGMVKHYISEKELSFKGSGHVEKNLEIVDYNYAKGIIEVGDPKHLSYKGCEVVHLHISEGVEQSKPIVCFVKFKYSPAFIQAKLFFKNNNSALIEFEQEVYPLIKSEMLVLYDSNSRNAKVIGSGKVGKRGIFNLVDRAGEFRKKEVGEDGSIKTDDSVTMFRF
jgi:tRNA-specific 2-thiouridylase